MTAQVCVAPDQAGHHAPLLIAAPGVSRYAGDGGDELQVIAMLRRWGLPVEADLVAEGLRDILYAETGLQFRTPAAVDREARFRAPLNLRPLAAWWLAV